MTTPRLTFGRRSARTPRALAVLLLLAAYLLTGLLHGLCDLGEPGSAGRADVVAIAATADRSPHGDDGIHADRHCHACFSVAVAAPPQPTPIAAVPQGPVSGRAPTPLADRAHALEPPPPKSLI